MHWRGRGKKRGLAAWITYYSRFRPGRYLLRPGETMIVSMGKKNDTSTPAPAVAESPALNKTTNTVPGTAGGNGAPAKAAKKKKASGFSPEDIALRAYFISESRSRNGIPGDSHSDWLEAERQLRSERRKTAPAKVSKASKGSRSKKRS